jgi:hypothetical protein
MAAQSTSGSKFIFTITVENARRAVALQDNLKDFFSKSKTKWSLVDRSSIEKLYTKFITVYNVPRSTLKEFGLTSAQALANLIYRSYDILEQENWNIQVIKEFATSKRSQKYQKWIKSKDYVEGRKLSNMHENPRRILVIYDKSFPGNPDTTYEYPIEGIMGRENTMQQVCMLKQDWHYQTGISFYDARPILLENYLKKSEEELRQIVLELDFD